MEETKRALKERLCSLQKEFDRLGRLRQFVSPQAAEAVLADASANGLRSERRDVVVVFFDLRGYTTFAQSSEPDAVMQLLRRFHNEIGGLANRHAGTIERFTGDGIMIFFDELVPRAGAAERAVRMALGAREQFAEITATSQSQGHDLGIGVGISSGVATVGPIGFEGRYDYAAIGPVTNLAARLCAEAKPNQILACQRVVRAIAPLVAVEHVGDLVLRGFPELVRAYNLLGLAA